MQPFCISVELILGHVRLLKIYITVKIILFLKSRDDFDLLSYIYVENCFHYLQNWKKESVSFQECKNFEHEICVRCLLVA